MALLALLLALLLTPLVRVEVFGQTLDVGAVPPSTSMGWSGSGEAELFGEGTVATVQHFDGPIRPRIVWQNFARNDEASAFIQTTTVNGRRVLRTDTAAVGTALAGAWLDYFVRLLIVAGLIGGVLHLAAVALAGMLPGERPRRGTRSAVLRLALSVVSALVLTAASGGISLMSARDQLAGVSTLADLTGVAPLVPEPVPVLADVAGVSVAVIGDSTAAGVGNDPLTRPVGFDEVCGRSRDASARVLQSALGVSVANLACSSATISAGLLGPQVEGNEVIPPQVGVLKSIPNLRVVVVSVGANDIGWSDFIQLCYGLPRCDDQVSASLAGQRLDRFRTEFTQLLAQLSQLPSRPSVIVTGYYDPFGTTFDCPALVDPHRPDVQPPGFGFASEGVDTVLKQKIEPLRSFLASLNALLAQGAEAFGYGAVAPSFAGHGLCSTQPWVQGLSARYPFHPNAAGELAIAAAELPHLATLVNGVGR